MRDPIDLPARRRLSGLMRQFAIGCITNDEFDQAFEDIDTADRAVHTIATDTFAYCNDYAKVRLTGRYRLSREWRRTAARWILFLQSGREYEDRGRSLSATLRSIGHTLALGLIAKGQENEAYEERERLIWPFSTQADFDEARRHPKLLCGVH